MPASEFAALAAEWMDSIVRHRPAGATALGIHDLDSELGDRSRSSIEGHGRALRGQLQRLERIDPAGLPREERPQHELLRRRILWELITVEDLATWRTAPGIYLSTIGNGCYGLIIRDFAPLEERARSVVSRLRQTPRLLEQAKANLDGCPPPYVETAIEQAAGIRLLLERDLPDALLTPSPPAPLPQGGRGEGAGATGVSAALRRDFEEAQSAALSALHAFTAWMKDDLLPRSDGDYAYGAERFGQLLAYTDFIEHPIEEMERRGREDLRACQERIRELAAQIDGSTAAAEVVDRIAQDHPAAERLLPETGALLEELRQFCIDRRLVTMPTEVRIQVTETPSFAAMTTQAACSTPGAFETKATEAYYYVTPPHPSWPAERTQAYMKFFNRYSLRGVSAHEAYPGHYVHISWLRNDPRRLPHFLLTTTTVEGWAHYVEQVMIEAGYGDGDPRFEIMQLREALLRLCRYLASIGLHTQGWTYDESVAFFEREGFATKPIAERETRRGQIGPNYYAYTLGKHEILSLREKVKAKQGAKFDLLAFHDAFMKLPYPIPTIERIMLGQEA